MRTRAGGKVEVGQSATPAAFLRCPIARSRSCFARTFFADAVRLRRHLEQLVVGEELDRVVERELADAVELRRDVGVAAAHVREVLLAHDVDLEVALADVLADDHALVHLDPRVEEELPAVLRRVEAERRGQPVLPGDERSEIARVDVAGVRAVAGEERVHHALAARAVRNACRNPSRPRVGIL